MKEETTGEVMGNPLWIFPVFIMVVVAMIEGLHTAAHIRMKVDADSYCRNNAEWIDMNKNNDDY